MNDETTRRARMFEALDEQFAAAHSRIVTEKPRDGGRAILQRTISESYAHFCDGDLSRAATF